jgi:hypothetical protein
LKKAFVTAALLVCCNAPAAVETQISVLIFVTTECPVSNRYAPEIQRLHRDFTRQGVRFQLVYPNPSDDTAAIGRHLAEYGYPPAIAVRDPDHELVRTAQATVTPEAAVFDGRRLMYRGRIDDRFVEIGRERPAATTSDLRDALTAVLSGTAVRRSRTQAIGCYIADMVAR